MRLADLLDESVVKLGLESVDKEECIEEMVELLVRSGCLSDRQMALDALFSREKIGSTGIGNGVAIPHAKSGCVEKLTAALGVSLEGIEFDAIDGQEAHLVFLLLADPQRPGPHVAALAEVARLLQLPGFYRKIVSAKTPEEVLEIISEEE